MVPLVMRTVSLVLLIRRSFGWLPGLPVFLVSGRMPGQLEAPYPTAQEEKYRQYASDGSELRFKLRF